jgi:hypothetical protein
MNTNTMPTAKETKMQRAMRLLPQGWTHSFHDEGDDGYPTYRYKTVAVWGVSIYDENENEVAFASKPDKGQRRPNGQLMADGDKCNAARLAVNRFAAAMWGQQPAWPANCYFSDAAIRKATGGAK